MRTNKVKMEKLKIISISSETYHKGRIDSFAVPLLDKNHKGISDNYIIPLLKSFDFKRDSVDDLDLDFENMSAGTWFFIYGNPKIKAWLIIEGKTLSINFDTSLPREKINKIVEKYFEFPKDK